MRVGYGFNRTPREFHGIELDRLWLDVPRSERSERTAMLQMGLRAGDTLVLLAKGDLGRGGEIPIIRRLLEQRRVTVEVLGKREAPKVPPGRPRTFAPNKAQDDEIKALWYTPGIYQGKYVLDRAEEIMGFPVTRNMLNHRYGRRDQEEGER